MKNLIVISCLLPLFLLVACNGGSDGSNTDGDSHSDGDSSEHGQDSENEDIVTDGDTEIDIDNSENIEAETDTEVENDQDYAEPDIEVDSVDNVESDDASETDIDVSENVETEIEVESDASEEDSTDSSELEADLPCVCSEGACCDGCHYIDEGVVCQAEVSTGRKCMDPEEDPCDQKWASVVYDRVCSGESNLCDGPTVLREEYEVPEDGNCSGGQRCDDTLGCVDAAEECCQCESGTCCVDCRYAPATTSCDFVKADRGCPWGNESGSDVGTQTTFQMCPGDGVECNGDYSTTEWQVLDYCWDYEYCDHGYCTPETCEDSWDCPLEHSFYCRQDRCVYSDDMCDDMTPGYGECAQENAWCNTYFQVCWQLDHVCETDNDCADHPDGEICNTETGQCGE